MKDTTKIRQVIDEKRMEVKEDPFARGYFVIFFAHIGEGELYTYDTREPIRAYEDISAKHPEYEFLRIKVCGTEKEAKDLCDAINRVRKARKTMLPEAETFKIVVSPKVKV